MFFRQNQQYFEELEQKLEALHDQEKQLALSLITIAQNPYYDSKKNIDELKATLLQISNGHSLYEPLIPVVTFLLGEYPGRVLTYILAHKHEYPYSNGYYRRPFRTADPICHFEKVITKITNLIELYNQPFSIMEYLTSRQETWNVNSIISDMIAYEIDQNPEAILPALKEIIYGENNTALLTTTMIKGIFLSHSQEAYKMIGELLIAARLQEGLRQSIVESMDEGSIEATIYMLNIIIVENFIRYSSVIRALDVWTGLNLEAMDAKVTKQCIQYAYQCLQDQSLCNEWSQSNDVNKLYMSLWATAVMEEKNLEAKVHQIMKHCETYQKIVAQSFLTQSQNDDMRFSIAQNYLEQTNVELQYFVFVNYVYEYSFDWNYHHGQSARSLYIQKVPLLEDKQTRLQHFTILKESLKKINTKELTFTSIVFNDYTITYSADMLAKKLLYLAGYDMDADLLAEVLTFREVISADTRSDILQFFLQDLKNLRQREFVIQSLSDKSLANREIALTRLEEVKLLDNEVTNVEALLKLKTGTIRQGVIKLLLGLEEAQFVISVERLVKSKNELQRLAALELILTTKEKYDWKEIIFSITSPSEKEKILLAKYSQTEEYNKENGFGLFDPTSTVLLPSRTKSKNDIRKDLFAKHEEIKAFIQHLSDLIHEHRNFEYEIEWYDGSKESFLLGTNLMQINRNLPFNTKSLDNLPLSDVWKTYLQQSGVGILQYLHMAFYFQSDMVYRYYFQLLYEWEKGDFQPVSGWRREFLQEQFPIHQIKEMQQWLEELPYKDQVNQLVLAFFDEYEKKKMFPVILEILRAMIVSLPEGKMEEELKLLDFLASPWLTWASETVEDDEAFKEYFYEKYHLYQLHQYDQYNVTLDEIIRAYDLKIIDENEVYKELLVRGERKHHMLMMTKKADDFATDHPSILPFKENVVQRILEIELKRGELETDVTIPAMGIEYYEGIEYFVGILAALDKETFVRGYIYTYGDQFSKKEVLSYLLKKCYPKQEDNEQRLAELLRSVTISEKRILEAAMYAPQWIEIVAKYLEWDGLRSAAWYFHAHINETFSAEKETIVAHYSPVTPEEFNDGAFDIQWFKTAYSELGEERFSILYDCAKYISGGANHRRSQLFADAVLGKLQLDSLKKSVQEKRNKDNLLCYSLVPISNHAEVLMRYEFIQQFLQQSKAFGSARRASEAKTVSIALANLARNAGYKDVVRLTWDMEAQKMKEVETYLLPKEIDHLLFQLVIDEDGLAEIHVTKQGKELKTIPAKYKKHDYVVQLKEVKTDLKNQWKRARAELERSMESGTPFTLKEIQSIMGNPVIAPLLKRIVLHSNEHIGYIHINELQSPGGKVYKISADDQILIAHPVHLYESGEWSTYQRDIFDRKVKQPFKQVFRELYLPNADELAVGTMSYRYAGHQVQPRKTAALLKNRLWTVSYEEGLQKVFYNENIIAKIYAVADWFSPSEVEAPTLETVEFIDRNSYKGIDLTKVPKIIFSETMRDVDLVVSVAHVGGVDPEASLTTIEMRKAIVKESLRLLQIQNVILEGNFALIKGSLGEYSVHLGSGQAYKQAVGALYIIPVHSQHRGKIFLPFLDEEPKTAEIVSKIIMLAQDTKIKDPYILEQLKG